MAYGSTKWKKHINLAIPVNKLQGMNKSSLIIFTCMMAIFFISIWGKQGWKNAIITLFIAYLLYGLVAIMFQ
jgi:hypothetical protein